MLRCLSRSSRQLARAEVGQIGVPAGKRREVFIGGRRVKTVDVHAHSFVPEVWDLVKDTPLAATAKANLTGNIVLGNPQRLVRHGRPGHRLSGDQRQRLGILGGSRRWLATSSSFRTKKSRSGAPSTRIASWAWQPLALQHPDLAADQLDEAVRKLGLRGAAIGGSVEGQELSDRKFDPFWAKAEELGVLLFMHPQPAAGTTQNPRLQGKGGLGNTIGNPLETTVFLSHLIFEGTLDRFPGLKICAAHAGGYLPSYTGRSDALVRRAAAAPTARHSRKNPASTSGASSWSTRWSFVKRAAASGRRSRRRSDGLRNGLSL